MLIKKICAICMAAVLLLAPAPPVFADNAGGTGTVESALLTIGNVTAEPGGSVTVPIILESNPGIAGVTLDISYDASILRIDSMAAIARATGGDRALNRLSFHRAGTYTNNPFRVLWFGTLNDPSAGVLMNVTFTVLENAPRGSTASITANVRISNLDGQIPAAIHPGSVHIPPLSQPPQPPPPPPNGANGNGGNEGNDGNNGNDGNDGNASNGGNNNNDNNNNGDNNGNNGTNENNNNNGDSSSNGDGGTQTPPQPPPPGGAASWNPADIMALFPELAAEIPQELLNELLADRPAATPPRQAQQAQQAASTADTAAADDTDDTEAVTFDDVGADAWYYEAVGFVASRGLFLGVGGNRFEPRTTMTRAMFITVLSRVEGIDGTAPDAPPFSDVGADRWYSAPIAWAEQAGIITEGILYGGEPGDFRPDAHITREEMAVLFANYIAAGDFDLAAEEAEEFADIGQASEWARDAIRSMRSYAIIRGMGDNTYNPQGLATRAEVAQIFTNLVRVLGEAAERSDGDG